MQGAADRFGTIHVAIACAGVAWPGLTLTKNSSINTEMFRDLFAVNVYGSMYMAKYASVIMSKNTPVNEFGEKGCLLFVSSVAGEEGQRGQVAYSASKGAINGMMMPMARDLGKYGIRVAAIAPGIFTTPMTEIMPDKLAQRLNRDTPLGRPGTAQEFAHFMASMIENSYINGVTLRLDGGIKFSNN